MTAPNTTLLVPAQSRIHFRPPSVPLITHDPYFSLWSGHDALNEGSTRHWTRAPMPLEVSLELDGTRWALVGRPSGANAATQVELRVEAMTTIADFNAGGHLVTLEFVSPIIPDDLELLSRPATYLRLRAAKELAGILHVTASGRFAADTPEQPVSWRRLHLSGLSAAAIGTVEQAVLAKNGDDLRIDWGEFLLATRDGTVTGTTAMEQSPAPAGTLSLHAECKLVEGTCSVIFGYDDRLSVRYMGNPLRPWWRQETGASPESLLHAAASEQTALTDRANHYGMALRELCADIGGMHYADLCMLAFRQTIAGHKLVISCDGLPLYFSKECFSNGCMGTVDVTYPSSPFFLLFNPALLEAQLRPVMEYASTEAWPYAFAPHDLGRYPHADGQVYGMASGKQDKDKMPVEECGNMLLMVAALAGPAGKTALAEQYFARLDQWAGYLMKQGFDPAEQLCTDDFGGHMASNANLSIKAIVAIGAWGQCCRSLGRHEAADRYETAAKQFAASWLDTAFADRRQAAVLAFGSPGTWSLKYNLIWDKYLKLGLFPQALYDAEILRYKSECLTFGTPLDSRHLWTKLDWIAWVACFATAPQDFQSLIEPVWQFATQTPNRVPLTDWYWADEGTQCMFGRTESRMGFQARTVVGGLFFKVLMERQGEPWSPSAQAFS